MKGFVLLAALLLVPSMAYFQRFQFEGKLQPALIAELSEELEAEGVAEGTVQIEWLDVTITGVVASEEKRQRMAELVSGRHGLRIAAGGNQLQVWGWVRVERKDGEWTAGGLLPTSFMLNRRDGAGEEWDAGVRREDWVQAPLDARELDEFLREYFAAPGDRSVGMRGGKLRMGGEATLGLRADWLAMASRVVAKEEVEGEFTLHPSRHHFAGYVPDGVEDVGRLRALRAELAALAVEFDPNSAEVTEGQLAKVSAAAAVMLKANANFVFLLEGSPANAEQGNEPLGARRARVLEKLLLGYGVKEAQLEVVAVDADVDGNPVHRVAILLK